MYCAFDASCFCVASDTAHGFVLLTVNSTPMLIWAEPAYSVDHPNHLIIDA